MNLKETKDLYARGFQAKDWSDFSSKLVTKHDFETHMDAVALMFASQKVNEVTPDYTGYPGLLGLGGSQRERELNG